MGLRVLKGENQTAIKSLTPISRSYLFTELLELDRFWGLCPIAIMGFLSLRKWWMEK